VCGVVAEPKWLSAREDRAWRTFLRSRDRLLACLQRDFLVDSGMTSTEYEILAVLSESPTGRMPAREVSARLQWEKSRLSHQVRRMQERGLIAREPNPVDARGVVIFLLPAGRRAVEDASPDHVRAVRRHFVDLFTLAELDTLADLNERILNHLAEEPFRKQRSVGDQGIVGDAS
jgi:DNA-binding MarR family transcriptional regulator